MIKVHLIKKDDQYISLEVVGHANYAEHGQDLVCAAVSAIVTGGFNAFNDSDIKSIELKDGYAFVEVNLNKGQEVLKVLEIQLKTLEESYPKYIKIK